MWLGRRQPPPPRRRLQLSTTAIPCRLDYYQQWLFLLLFICHCHSITLCSLHWFLTPSCCSPPLPLLLLPCALRHDQSQRDYVAWLHDQGLVTVPSFIERVCFSLTAWLWMSTAFRRLKHIAGAASFCRHLRHDATP